MVTVTLPDLVRADLGEPARCRSNEFWWHCPYHQDDTPSFQVDFYQAKQVWRYKCWACECEGDAVDWLVEYRHMDEIAAWRMVRGDTNITPPPPATVERRHVTYADPPAKEWQDAALDVVLDCAIQLQNPTDRRAATALDWLKARGLRPAIIERALLGWNPTWREVLPGQRLAPGITIPAFTGDSLWYLKVRLTKQEATRIGDKYLALAGSKTASLYSVSAGVDGLVDARVAVATEGEFDALLLSQFFGTNELAVVTMGSATALPGARWRRYLAWLDKLLVVMDADSAGAKANERWREIVQWVQLVEPPNAPGKDITDWWKAGVNLRAWLEPYLIGQSPDKQRTETILARGRVVEPVESWQDALVTA